MRPAQLPAALAQGLVPVYRISGDEPFQVGECCDQIRQAAREGGYTEITRHVVETGFDWNQIAADAASLSLFGERRLIDLQLTGNKPGREGSQAISDYCDAASDDVLLLLRTPRLDAATRKQKWCQSIDRIGLALDVYPLDLAGLRRWIGQRLQGAGFQANSAVVALIADYVEGNMLAAAQEIEKMALLCQPGELDEATAAAVLTDSARYDPFDFADCLMRGDAARAIRMLQGMRQEGVNENQLLWIIADKLRKSIELKEAEATGASTDAILRHVWRSQQQLLRQCAGRLNLESARELLAALNRLDWIAKGQAQGDIWDEMANLCLQICDRTSLKAASAA